jgi:hypothetical protein
MTLNAMYEPGSDTGLGEEGCSATKYYWDNKKSYNKIFRLDNSTMSMLIFWFWSLCHGYI